MFCLVHQYHFLTTAPVKDPHGYRTFVKYSRKTQQQYVASMTDDDKATGWTAFYENGKWVEATPVKKTLQK